MVGSQLGREEREPWRAGGAVSVLSLLTTRGQCWHQAAWLCWKTAKGRWSGRGRKEASILTEFYLT